jgi:putative nucleotidyltransferase with HDIG domain
LTFIISWGGTPLDIREGQSASRDYLSRVEFRWRDEAKTVAKRDRAAETAPNVYDEDLSSINILLKDLVDLLQQIADPAEELPGGPDLVGKLGLTDDELTVLRRALEEADFAEIQVGIAAVFGELRVRQVIERARFEREKDEGHWTIKVLSKGADEPRPAEMEEVIVVENAETTLRNRLMRDNLGEFPSDFRRTLSSLIARRLEPTLTYNEPLSLEEEKGARAAVGEEIRVITVDEVLLRRDEVAEPEDIEILKEENRVFWSSVNPLAKLRRVAGTALVVSVIIAIGALCITRFGMTSISLRGTLALALMCLATVVAARALAAVHLTYLVPVSAVAIVFAIVSSATFALAATFLLVVLLGITLSYDFAVMLTFLAGSVTAILGSTRIRKRTRLIKVGILIGLVQAVTLWGMWLATQWEMLPLRWSSSLVRDSAAALFSGIGVGFLLTGALPFIERLFNVVTDISLLELSDQNHPLLRRLVLEAPGTYHHSFIVGSLGEAAAEETDANALLARIGSYYHDIGKVARPDYFVENQAGKASRHDKLAPAMSSLIIISHVKEGLEMAKAQGLPPRIIDFIAQHHGTSLVEYFYQSALSRTNGNQTVHEGVFRYPGPKPQSKEAAIILLADALEAASRTLSEPSPSRIERFVDEIVAKRLAEGELDESGLTLTEIGRIKQSFSRVLTGIYHSRIKYPKANNNSERGRHNAKTTTFQWTQPTGERGDALEGSDK